MLKFPNKYNDQQPEGLNYFRIKRIVAKFLAIDWDETECRYAVATLQNEKIAIRDVGIVPVVSVDDDLRSSLDTLSTALYSLCKEEKIGSCPLLISLGRNEVEWVQQKLPPCKESEIPLLLKNQVLREVSGSTEADPMDYLVLESSYEGHRVLALTISQAFRRSLTRTFRSLGHPPVRIGFRAGNVAELVLHNPELLEGDPAAPRLVVDVVGNDVDLIIIAGDATTGGRISAIRSFRLPAEDQHKNLADEIERTLTIGLEGGTPLSIQHVVLFGDGTETELPEYLSQNGLSVQFLNPFTLPNVSVSKSVSDPEKFAPLIGSLLIQSQKIKPVIDFLHPKEAPKPINYARPALAAFLLLGIICGGLYYGNQGAVSGLEAKLAETTAEHQQVASELQQLYQSWRVLGATVAWESQNVVWLDVLKDLSIVLPDSTDLVVTHMTFRTGPITNNPRSAGTIELHGFARDPSVLQDLQGRLHMSGRYWMPLTAPSPNPAGGGYPWRFHTTIHRLR